MVASVIGWALEAKAADPAVRAPPSGGPVVALVATVGRAAAAWSALSGEPVEMWRFALRHAGGRLLG